LPVNHRELIPVYENIDQIYHKKNLNSISSDSSSNISQHTSLTYNTIANIFHTMNNYEKALLYYQYAYQLESRMSSPNVLYIEDYQNNIRKTKNQLSKSIFRKLLAIIETIYEYFVNSG